MFGRKRVMRCRRLVMFGRKRVMHGFTLVELICALLLLTLLGISVSSWLGFGARIYAEGSARSHATDELRFALLRLSRELALAVPNSLRVAGDNQVQCLEWVLPIAAGTYMNLPLTAASTSLNVAPITGYSFNAGEQLLVAPLTTADVYAAGSSQRRVLAAYNGSTTLTLNSATTFGRASPGQRFYIINTPLSYCLRGGALYRYSDYPLLGDQPVFASNVGVLMAEHLVNNLNLAAELPFSVSGSNLSRQAIAQIRLLAAVANGSEPIEFLHSVAVTNVP